MPIWNSPTYRVKTGKPHDLWFDVIDKTKTVVKFQGNWRTLVSPQEDFLNACDVVLRGGFVIEISEELATELSEAGFADYIKEA
jgi:uncharacterized protein with NAD-binding domain and iron-sulfur cluster